ncbi:hypothetical protein QE152_g31295 [Popillia japonica]|uniref:Uncharacterized protein n=1 Tax=Popillia japonica TaxID=7064 RepID=A0AAW1JBV3_POPJA
MESEAAAVVPPEECDSGVCVNTTAEATIKLSELDGPDTAVREAEGATRLVPTPAQQTSAQQITNPAPSEPDITEPGAAAAARDGNSEPGALKDINSGVGAVASTVEETNITRRSKLEDGIGSLASEESVSENPESLSNENEAEGKLRRQNASHRLVEGVRISSKDSTDSKDKS